MATSGEVIIKFDVTALLDSEKHLKQEKRKSYKKTKCVGDY